MGYVNTGVDARVTRMRQLFSFLLWAGVVIRLVNVYHRASSLASFALLFSTDLLFSFIMHD